MTIGEGRYWDWPVNGELCLLGHLFLYHDGPIRWPPYYGCGTDPPVNPMFYPSHAHKQDPMILKLLHNAAFSHPEGGKPPFFDPSPQTWRCWFVSQLRSTANLMSRTSVKGHAPTCTGNRSELLPAMQIKLLLQSHREVTAFNKFSNKTPLEFRLERLLILQITMSLLKWAL